MRLRATSPRFVGRVVELDVLDDLLVGTRTGTPVTVLICGEAGAGKTRLVAEVVARAQDRGARTLVGNCTTVGRTSLAFAPFAEILRSAADDTADDDGPTRIAPRLARLVAESGGAAASGESAGLDPLGEFAQLGLFEEVLDTIERGAVPNGLLVVVEDLHWADRSSRGLFEFLCRNLQGVSVALVGTVRSDEPDDARFLMWLAEMQRSPGVVRLDLEPFSRDEIADLLAGVLGEPPSADFAGQVFERSGGNAFLAEELVAAGDPSVRVPATVRRLVLARMAGLTAPARGLLRLAAVAGVRVGHGLLAAAGHLREDVLLAAARELVDSHLLVTDPSVEGHAFRHALTQEAVYDDLLPGERRRLHRAVAQALSDEPALGPSAGWALAEALAEHWLAADELTPALAMSVSAGDAAREVLAGAEALDHYERALELWDRVPEPETVVGVGRSVLLERAAEVASGAGYHDRAIRHMDAAISALLEQSPAVPEKIGLLCASKSNFLWRAGRSAETLEWTGRAVEIVPTEPPTPGRAAVLSGRARALASGSERYDEAFRLATAALEVAQSVAGRKQEADARIALGVSLGMTSTDPEAGPRELDQAIAIGREIGDASAVVYAYGNLVDSLIRLGRVDEAAATAIEATEVGLDLGALRSWVGLSLFNGAEALFLAGRWEECSDALGRLRDQRPGGLVTVSGLALTALLRASRGQDDAAVAAIADARSVGIGDAEIQGMLRAAHAQVALNQGDLEVASRAALDGLDRLAGSQSQVEVVDVVSLAGLGLHIESDRAQVARARRDQTAVREAVESARTVATRTLDLRARAAAAAHRQDVARAHRALCEAELGRAEGRSDPDAWCTAADGSATRTDPYQAAYARFREAEAVLSRRGHRARAVAALTAARTTAGQLGAEPLCHEIEALAGRARIELAAAPEGPAPHQQRVTAALGLTSRELEVLRLLAAGYTNPQIGEALYISRKTASHHVSSILAKLGVSTRVEAAGVAHRLGLTPDTTAPK